MRGLGNTATIDELNEAVIAGETFTDEQLAVLHKDGPRSEIEYRLAWARTYLKGMGAFDNPKRGVWISTELGKDLQAEQIESLRKQYVARLVHERKDKTSAARAAGASGAPPEATDVDTDDWRETLLQVLLVMDPTAFEHLARRLLRAAGFINTKVTVRSGDGGIDGVGVYRLSLVSFPVFFQCKRYKGSVGPDKVRDFRGAMAGRGDKGLLITTGTFTAEAKNEATRDGAPPIDLIDGERLCELLKEHELGVRTTTRIVEEVEVLADFFAQVAG
jgi:restriction system protein